MDKKDLDINVYRQKGQNKILNDKIQVLTKELEDEKAKSKKLNNIIIDLNSQLINANKTIKDLSDEFNPINLKNDNNELQKIITIKMMK